MPEPLLFAAVAILAAVVVAMPILLEDPDRRAPRLPEEDRDALALRHRIAIESLRDVEADHRSGSLDVAAYGAERALAQQRAMATRAALDAAPAPAEAQRGRDARLLVGGVGIALGVLLAGGVLLGIPANLANATVTNQALADRMAQADARQARITELLGHLRADPEDTDALSELADLYLASGTQADRNAAQPLLLLVSALDPGQTDALVKLATAYLQSGQPDDASAVVDRIETIDPGSVDIPFFRGLIARQRGDDAAARAAFEAFLQAAPDDSRGSMVRGLIAELDPGS
ncbi:MAG: tetratricopeptide repeat protein [Chloroflexota bacterium]